MLCWGEGMCSAALLCSASRAWRSGSLAAFPMAEEVKTIYASSVAGACAEGASLHIVYVVPPEGEDPEAFHIRTLASVLGSEDAAKQALVYHYKHAASGFAAKLTPQQAADLAKKPGVVQVVPCEALHPHGVSAA